MNRHAHGGSWVTETASTSTADDQEGGRHATRLLLSEFRERVRDDPDKLAVVDEDRSLTYAELDAWSSSMAHGLLAARPTAQPVVALVAWLGLEAIAVQQAVLKAGLVLAPLDPREPDEVLSANAERLGARLVLIDRERAAELRPAGGRSAISTPDQLDSGVTTPPDGPFDPSRPILLGATSGSTGRSRSVVFPPTMTEIMNELRLVHSAEARVGILLPPMFVAANGPITSSWRSGATAYCYDLSERPADGLPSWMERVGLTAFALTPSLVRSVFEPWMDGGRPLPRVSHVTLTGETLTGNDVQVLRKVFPNATFVNVYGAADAALVSRFEIPPGMPVPDGPVSVGRPVRPVEIADDDGRPLPEGHVGMITAVGPWLPKVVELDGPLDLATLDLDRVRRASTGDLGRMQPDGTLELLGRADHRVKVRGQMVDPSRVEEALVGLEEVQDAVVSAVAREESTTLVAHVVSADRRVLRERDLRRALRGDLPSFMVPARFVVVTDLPRLATGKADRLVLAELAASAAPERPVSPEPSGVTEEALAGFFSEILGLDSVGRDDDFFDLGGDSLAAVELMAAMEGAFGVTVESGAVMEVSTVAGLARWVEAQGGGSTGSSELGARSRTGRGVGGGRRIITLRGEGSRPPVYVVPGGGNNLFQLKPLADALDDRPVHELVPKGLDARSWPSYTVESAARRHIDSLASVPAPFVLAGYSYGALVAWEMARELTAAGRPPSCLVLLDPSGFDEQGGRIGPRARYLLGRLARPSDDDEAVAAGRADGSAAGTPRRGPGGSSALTGLRSVARLARRAATPTAIGKGLVVVGRVGRLYVPPLTVGVVGRGPVAEDRLFMDVSRFATYRYRPRPFGGRVVLVGSTQRQEVRPGELTSVERLAGGELTRLVVAGDHTGILRPPWVHDLAAQLDAVLG